MTDHPLTDDIAESIAATELQCPFGIGELVFTHDDMRAATDWQLEQAIRYLENDLEFVLWSDSFMDKFKKAMRPQEDNS